MKFISTRVHGVIDYLYSLVLLAIPTLLHFDPIGIQTSVADVIASAVFTYSLFTRYELALFRNIPMRVHLLLDVIVNVVLIASPWIFHFSRVIHTPYVVIGVAGLLVVLFSKTEISHKIKAGNELQQQAASRFGDKV